MGEDLPRSGLHGIGDLLILAVDTGTHALKAVTHRTRQAKGAGVLSVELLQHLGEGAAMTGEAGNVAVGAAHVAEPLDGHGIVSQDRIHTVKVE